jgi:chromosome segregation ATPase
MATNTNQTANTQEITELKNRLDWLDQERRKLNRKLSDMEQQAELQSRDMISREQRVQELERQLAGANAQLARIPQIDTQLSQFKDDIVKMIEQYDQRRLQSEAELDRIRRVEHEVTAREIANLRKEASAIPQFQNTLDLRHAEETRLANLIGNLHNQVTSINNQIENFENAFAFLEEKEKKNNRTGAELQASIAEINKRAEHFLTRLDTLTGSVSRIELKIRNLTDEQNTIQESTKTWMEQIQIGEYERNQKLETWRRAIEDHNDTLDRFKKEWIAISDQYKEAKMAVETFSHWQTQVEKQQREASELLRVETHRLQSRWDDFLLENKKAWKNFEVDAEQRWSAVNRHEREMREQITKMEELLEKLQQEKDTLRRVQDAQSTAIKQFPRIWLEQVEKAIEQNPTRRRQPALIPVREE